MRLQARAQGLLQHTKRRIGAGLPAQPGWLLNTHARRPVTAAQAIKRLLHVSAEHLWPAAERRRWRKEQGAPVACSGVMRPAAMGRLFVRSTLASRSRSQRSFTVQPAPLSSSAPAPNSASSRTSGSASGGPASAMDQKQGHARSHVPAGVPNQATRGAMCLWARQIRLGI